MARPKKAVVDYFPHYTTHGKTMFTLESKFKKDGYCFWFKLLELLGESEHHFINCNDAEAFEYMLARTLVDEGLGIQILDLMAKLNAIDSELWENKIIWSENFINNLECVYSRRTINVYTKTDILSLCIQKPQSTEDTDGINPQSKVKESRVDNNDAINSFFESIWKLYPEKKNGKSTISNTNKKDLYKISFEEMKRAIERYSKEVYDDREGGFKERRFKDASAFFKTNYKDYLDATFEENKCSTNKKQVTPFTGNIIIKEREY